MTGRGAVGHWVLLCYRLPREASTPPSHRPPRFLPTTRPRRRTRRGPRPARSGRTRIARRRGFDRGRGGVAVNWAPRRGVHIDRAACAWLIRRFVDPDARFTFVADPADVPADATAFDMRGVDLGHHGGDCSFETILRRRGPARPVLWRLARIAPD